MDRFTKQKIKTRLIENNENVLTEANKSALLIYLLFVYIIHQYY